MSDVNVGLRKVLHDITKVEAGILSDFNQEKLEHIKEKIAKRIAPAIPRQFLCNECNSYIVECPKCREVSLFKLQGSHQCEDCGWNLIIGESNDRDDA